MAINRNTFLKTLSGVGIGLMAGQLNAASFGQQHTSGELALARNEEKHLQHFYAQLSASPYMSADKVRAFQPARIVRREAGFRSYQLEYIAQNGSRIMMAGKQGKLVTRTF